VRLETKNASALQRDLVGCPDGILKIFCFSEIANQFIYLTIPSHFEGRIAIVTDAGWDAVDVEGASDERA
jgi:hypothetical protein